MLNPTTILPRSCFRLNRCRWILLGILAAAGPAVRAAEPVYELRVVTDRADALYRTGEEARFLITLTLDGQPVSTGTVSYAVDDFITEAPPANDFPQGELELGGPLAVRATSARPGFLRCLARFRTPEGRTVEAVAGAGFAPQQIAPSLPVPDDFDSFWADQSASWPKCRSSRF